MAESRLPTGMANSPRSDAEPEAGLYGSKTRRKVSLDVGEEVMWLECYQQPVMTVTVRCTRIVETREER